MEHFKSPFSASDLASARALDNRRFFDDVLAQAQHHPFFSHPFLSTCPNLAVARDIAALVLTSFYKIVAPFTGLLCTLGGRSPDIKARFALLDNLYEEMGCGDLALAHPSLYLQMLESIGVTPGAADACPTLPSIRRINEHLEHVVGHEPFAVGCALLASAEATIPPSFPVLAALARNSFPEVDVRFFDRHGARDEGHSNDAALLFALSAAPSDFRRVEACVKADLDARLELLDEWHWAMTASPTRSGAQEPAPPGSRLRHHAV